MSDPLWSAEALCVVAAYEGLHATPRLIRDWGDLGLLDRPPVVGRGNRRGVAPSVWPDHQRALLLLLLRQRKAGASIAAMCRIPVFLWLQWGDDYVPLRQTRRALATWAKAVQRPAVLRAHEAARSAAERLGHPAAKPAARRRFRETIGRGQAGEALERAEFLGATKPAFDPSGGDAARGPAGSSLTAEGYVEQVQALLRTADILAHDPKGREIPDSAFEEARERYRTGRQGYRRDWRTLAADPELGHLHGPPTAEAVVNGACRDLTELLALGLARDRKWQFRPSPRRR